VGARVPDEGDDRYAQTTAPGEASQALAGQVVCRDDQVRLELFDGSQQAALEWTCAGSCHDL
jgi:hypothetical protein